MTVKWVTTEWLEEHLDDEDIMLLDAQPNVHDYIGEHLPGAVYFSEGLLRASAHGLPGRYVPPASIESVLRVTGVSNDCAVVVYSGTGVFKGWGDGLEQTMVAYSLARFGHENVCLLDGGLDLWKAEDRPLTKHFPRVAPSDFTCRVRGEYFIEYEEFMQVKDSDAVTVIDARPTALYEGQGPWMKPGHIPGALSLPWPGLMDAKNRYLLRSDAEIRHIVESRGIDPAKSLIVYCGTGREATNEFLLLKWYLGYPQVRLYEGSFTEWTAHPENPTVVGSSPRGAESEALTYW